MTVDVGDTNSGITSNKMLVELKQNPASAPDCAWIPAAPLSLQKFRSVETGGFASPSRGGFAYIEGE
jgi:hypothetical protein